MASIKVILRKNKTNAEGKHPIALQIIKDRRPSLIHLGQYLDEKDWDISKSMVRKSHPNHVRLNNMIRKKLAEASDKSLELENQKDHVSAKAIKSRIKRKAGETFFSQGKLYLDGLKKAGRYNRYSADAPRIERFKEFLGGDVAFPEISIATLERFKAWLKGTYKVGDRTVANYLVVIRSVFSLAMKAELVDAKHYPFGKGKLKIKFPDTSKVGLSAEEIAALEQAELPELQNHSRNLFLFSFYMAGMRISDVLRLRWSDIQDGRLHYIMGKNNKGGNLKLPEKANAILEQYREDEPTHDLIFPQLKSLFSLASNNDIQRRIKSHVHDLNKQLRLAGQAAKIKKKLSMHIARHSFAQLAGDKIDIRVLQSLYRHSSIQTTIGYQSNFITKRADDALEAVIGF